MALFQGLVEHGSTLTTAWTALRRSAGATPGLEQTPVREGKNDASKRTAPKAKPYSGPNAAEAASSARTGGAGIVSADPVARAAAPGVGEPVSARPATNPNASGNGSGFPITAGEVSAHAVAASSAVAIRASSARSGPAPLASGGSPRGGSAGLAFALRLIWQPAVSGKQGTPTTELESASGAIASGADRSSAGSSDNAWTAVPPEVLEPVSGGENQFGARSAQIHLEPSPGMDFPSPERENRTAQSVARAAGPSVPGALSPASPIAVGPGGGNGIAKIHPGGQTPAQLEGFDGAVFNAGNSSDQAPARVQSTNPQKPFVSSVQRRSAPAEMDALRDAERARVQQPEEPVDLTPVSRTSEVSPAAKPRQATGAPRITASEAGNRAGAEDAASADPGTPQPANVAVGSVAWAKGRAAAADKPEPANPELPGANAAALTQTPEPATPSDPHSQPAACAAAAPVVPNADPHSSPVSQPVREVSLRLAVGGPESSSASVDVQLAERAGRVQVAVRTADQDLAKSLQGNLSDLVGRLEEKGLKTEAWTPALGQHGGLALQEASSSSANQDASHRSGSQDTPPDSRGQHQSGQRRQGRWQAEGEQSGFAAALATAS